MTVPAASTGIAYKPVDTGIDVPAGPVALGTKEAIEKALDKIMPPDHRYVVLGGLTYDGSSAAAHFAAAVKIGDQWQIETDIDKRWGGPVSGRVLAMWSGK